MCRFKYLWLLFVLALGTAAGHAQNVDRRGQAAQIADEQSIADMLRKQFDKPDAPLRVPTVTVSLPWALAGWTQGSTGGRALLKKESDKWVIHICGGDGLQKVETLSGAGVEAKPATLLASRAAAAERTVPEAERKKFDLFLGMLNVKTQPAHDHGQGQGQPNHQHKH